jgi:hypothetical protein
VLQLTVDENGNMRGDSVNASSRGITGKWVIDNTGKVTGTGTTAFSRYSSYYVANTTWNLQMNTDKNQLSGTWDIQVPYSDMRNMSMTVSKK